MTVVGTCLWWMLRGLAKSLRVAGRVGVIAGVGAIGAVSAGRAFSSRMGGSGSKAAAKDYPSEPPPPKLVRSDEEWREKLNPQQYAVLRKDGTPLWDCRVRRR